MKFLLSFLLAFYSFISYGDEGGDEYGFLKKTFSYINYGDVSSVNLDRLKSTYDADKKVNYTFGLALMMYYFEKEDYSKVVDVGMEVESECNPVCYNYHNSEWMNYPRLSKLTGLFYSRFGYSLYEAGEWSKASEVIALGIEVGTLRKKGVYSYYLNILCDAAMKSKQYGVAERYLMHLSQRAKDDGTAEDYNESIYERARLEVLRNNYIKAKSLIYKIKENGSIISKLKEDPGFSEFVKSKYYNEFVGSD